MNTEALREAIENEGVEPNRHRYTIKRHRAEWPVLWRAIDALLEDKKPPGWDGDNDKMASAIAVTARFLIDRRDDANEVANRAERAARAAGHNFDTRIDYARGSSAAYQIAIMVLAGAMGEHPSVLAAEIASDRSQPMARPVLPGELTDLVNTAADSVATTLRDYDAPTGAGDSVEASRG